MTASMTSTALDIPSMKPQKDSNICVVNQKAKVCIKSKWAYTGTTTPRMVRKAYHVRRVQPQRYLMRHPRPLAKQNARIHSSAPKKEEESSITLRLRGGGMFNRKRVEFDPKERLPKRNYWLAGGDMRYDPPTAGKVMEWNEQRRRERDDRIWRVRRSEKKKPKPEQKKK